MTPQKSVNSEQKVYDENAKKIEKMKFCIISNYGYLYMTTSLQNFVLDN